MQSNRAVLWYCRIQCGTTRIPDLIYKRQGQTHKKVVLAVKEQTNAVVERLMNHCNTCSSPLYDIKSQKSSCSLLFFLCLVNYLKLLWNQYHVYDKMREGNCVLHEWLILLDVLLHLQLHLHLRHETLSDVHNDNPESSRKCCITSGTVQLRSKKI